MKQVLLVFLGGGFGSALRYLISSKLNPIFQNFYLGTFSVNIVGCLIMGLLMGWTFKNNILNQNTSLLLATGFCGGFTTFSAFALEKYLFLKEGQYHYFFLYLATSIVLGILAVALGIYISKNI